MASWADRVDALRQWQREKNYEESNRNALAQILQGAYTPPTEDQVVQTQAPGPYRPGVDAVPVQPTTIPGSPGGYDVNRVTQALAGSRFAPEAMGLIGNQFQMQNEIQKMLINRQIQQQMTNDFINRIRGGQPGVDGEQATQYPVNSAGMPIGLNMKVSPQGFEASFDSSKYPELADKSINTQWVTGRSAMPIPGQAPSGMNPSQTINNPNGGYTNYGGMSPSQYGEAQKAIMQNRSQQDYEGVNKLQQDLVDKANSSRQALNITSQMRDLTQNFTPGKLNDTKATVAAYAQAIGMPKIAEALTGLDPTATSSIQEFGKLTAQLVSQQVKETSNRMLQSEFNVFLKNNPNPTLTPQALSQLLDFMDRASMYNINGLHDFTVYKQQHPNMTQADFADFNNQRIIADIRANQGRVVRPSAIPQGSQTATNPQTGQKIFSPDGNNWFDAATGKRL